MSLLKAIKSCNSKKISKLLQSNNFDANETEKSSGNNLLHTCVNSGDFETLEILLNEKNLTDLLCNINDNEYSPVELAITNMDIKCLQILLNAGSMELYEDFELEQLATDVSDPECLKVILAKGGNINRKFEDGGLLTQAIMNHQEAVIEFLLGESDLDLTLKGQNNEGVLQLCIMIKNSKYLQMIIECLLERKKKGNFAGNEEVVLFKDRRGRGILHALADQEMKIMYEFLLNYCEEFGIDIDMKDGNGRTVADIWGKKHEEALKKKEMMKENEKIRKKMKRERKIEKEIEKQETYEREKLIEEKIKKNKIKDLENKLNNQNRNGFVFVMFLVIFFVLAYLFIKFKIEYKDEYLIGSKKIAANDL